MNFLKDLTGDKKEDSPSDKPGEHLHKQSSSELLSSAKLVAEAAQSALHNQSDKVDKAKVAGAAGDLCGAAKDYGKMGEEGVGKYMTQAETYLHQYQSSHSSTTTPAGVISGDSTVPAAKKEEENSVAKMAQGFLGKH